MLADFLRDRRGPATGWNCSTMPGDWCVSRGHPDFVAPWRHILGLVECERVAADAGGLVMLWRQGIGEGLPEAAEPYQGGDIAVITIRGFDMGALFTGERWAVQLPVGLLKANPADVLVQGAWRP
jgi:hypothetical protein